MIVDLHTHFWRNPEQLGPQVSAKLRAKFAHLGEDIYAGAQLHEEAMEPVDVAVVLGWQSRHLSVSVPNDMISEYVKTNPAKLVGFAGIDPTSNGYLNALDDAVSLGLKGVSVSPSDQNFHPMNTRAMTLFEACADRNLPVLIHRSPFLLPDSAMEYAQPYLLDEVCRSIPNLRLVIARTGQPWVEQTLALIDKHEHVYTDISSLVDYPWQLYNTLLLAHQMNVMEKVLFGSGYPFSTPQKAIESIYSLNRFTQPGALPSVPREKLRSIVERDTLECLGIQVPGRQLAGDYKLSDSDSVTPKSRSEAKA